MCFELEFSGKLFRGPSTGVQVRCTPTSRSGNELAFLLHDGGRGWPSMTRWSGSRGDGSVRTGARAKLRWPWKPWDQTRRSGGKKGSKVSLLVDERGVPLSLVVCGANQHDVTQLEALLDALVVPNLRPDHEIHLCVDKGYRGAPANDVMCDHTEVPQVPVTEEERTIILNAPDHPPRRWVVKVGHSWFKRFRKRLVRYEKTKASSLGLLHLAAAVTCWRQVGVICG